MNTDENFYFYAEISRLLSDPKQYFDSEHSSKIIFVIFRCFSGQQKL